jgi:hypoxanthine phosphoribosyltransferase
MKLAQNDPKLGKVLLTASDIKKREAKLAKQISLDYKGKNPLLIGALKGAFIFLSELMFQITEPVEVDFMAVSSYGNSTKSSGKIRLLKDIEADIKGRHVIIVEDIIDSGLTIEYLRGRLQERQPASLEVCTLVMREKLKGKGLARYVGFYVPPEFIVGHGFDAGQKYRNLPDVHIYNS